MVEIYSIPDTNASGIPLSIPVGGNGGLFGNGGNTIGELIGLAIVASIFGWNNNGNGFGFGGGNAGGAGFLSNQLSNDSGRELIMNAVTSQGEAQRTAIQTLASTIGQDFNLVNGAVTNVQNALNQIANAQGMNTLQVINAIQSGNASLASQFAQCCCENRLSLCQLGNTIGQGFAGVQQSLAAKSAADQLSTCQQTYNLTDTMNRNFIALDNKIDALESGRKDREITALTAKVAELESQKFTTGVVQQAVTPVLGQLANLANEVEAIKRCQPPTVTLPNNQYTAVPTLYANIGADFVASYWANRLSQATTPATPDAGTAA